jgi:hypothetical protein
VCKTRIHYALRHHFHSGSITPAWAEVSETHFNKKKKAGLGGMLLSSLYEGSIHNRRGSINNSGSESRLPPSKNGRPYFKNNQSKKNWEVWSK